MSPQLVFWLVCLVTVLPILGLTAAHFLARDIDWRISEPDCDGEDEP